MTASWLPSDADLVDFYYGECARAADVERLLGADADLAARYAGLCAVLGAVQPPVAPDRPADWEATLWRRLEPELERRPASSRAWLRVAGLAAAAAAVVVAAFLAGRSHGRSETREAAAQQGFSQESRDRLLLAAAIDHLDRSEVFLVNLKNDGELDAARARAAELVVSNRLLRRSLAEDRSAEREGAQAPPPSRAGLSAVLDDLEPLLLEIAHAPDDLAPADLDLLRTRLRERGTLLKLRTVQGRLQRETQTAPAARAPRA